MEEKEAQNFMIHRNTLLSLEYDKIIGAFANLCQSEPGRERALALLPLPSREEAEKEFRIFNEAELWLGWQKDDCFSLSSCPDLSGLFQQALKKSENKSGYFIPDLESFWAIRAMLSLASSIIASISEKPACEKWPLLYSLYGEAPFPSRLFQALQRCISDDARIKDESSPELLRVRNEIRSLHQSCLRRVKDLVQQYNMAHFLQDDFMTLSSDRYVLPLKANFKGRMQGIIHDWSQTGETCYFEPVFLVEINNRLQELKREEKEEERKILEYLASLLLDELESAISAFEMLINLDILQAKHRLAQLLNASVPQFTASAEGIELYEARHPLLVLDRLKKENSTLAPVRPLDIILRPGDNGLVITGGNAGGKTVCLKTLGLITAMTMSALPAPVQAGSHIPWFDRMDAFIGDEQSLANNVSTFTAQIDHLSKAWKYLNNNGLVLLDEFGAGTDPAEGSALSQAVLDELLEKKCFFLSATHFPALKTYALSKARVRAASMLFNPETGQPLFKLAYDQVGASQALVVAEKYGLPETIISRAKHYLLQDGKDSSALIERLNELATARENEIEALKQQTRKASISLNEKSAKLDREREKLRTEVNSRISELMKAWKEGKAGPKQTLKEFSGIRQELGLPEKDTLIKEEPAALESGQTVFHSGFKKRGVITEIDSRKNKVRLDLNGVKIWANPEDLRTDTARPPIQRGSISTKVEPARTLSIDVRGKRAEEAREEVSRFIDRAILSGFNEVEIVHGKGTGALRKELRNYLKTFPAISRMESAPEDRGGDGMTIVSLD